MAKNSFRIIGIKAVWPQPEEFPVADARYYDKVESIQKGIVWNRPVVLFL